MKNKNPRTFQKWNRNESEQRKKYCRLYCISHRNSNVCVARFVHKWLYFEISSLRGWILYTHFQRRFRDSWLSESLAVQCSSLRPLLSVCTSVRYTYIDVVPFCKVHAHHCTVFLSKFKWKLCYRTKKYW